ncbi:hypothetical protein C8A05DRAFT_18503 [Staphylotrichum tortipilum]|uniref:Uncharacterized protein n=1 Tax=Staphylotrichum tortipilum TaxID=2831512 RepID=A0AAN6MF63_9PEZI|nr:hypothetical protein C8A05DRAFT_18503 [Staphylotrichum longicolle]
MGTVPFPADVGLIGNLSDCHIPDGTADRLGDELSCAVLDELYPNLDFVARKSNRHIDPIHKHLQKGRKIVLTEDPNLHLVWNYGTVYLKPLPHYLLSHSFWDQNLAPGSEHRGNALGFVRSYERLIRYPSDFELAKEAQLIPSSRSPPSLPPGQQPQQQPQQQSTEELSYATFTAFIRYFSSIADADVAPRWHFGQVRLSRLNWAVRILQPRAAKEKGFLHRLFYQEQFWQTGQFLNEFAAPLLFVFAALSIILSAMQVVLAAKSGDDTGSWQVFGEVSAWFAVVVIIVLVVVFIGLGAIMVGIWAWQFRFGYRSQKRNRTDIGPANMKTGPGGV